MYCNVILKQYATVFFQYLHIPHIYHSKCIATTDILKKIASFNCCFILKEKKFRITHALNFFEQINSNLSLIPYF